MKLTLTGPGIAAPIDIVDPSILDRSNVWAGSFIGETLAEAPRISKPIYTITFMAEPPAWRREPARTMYAVSVARDAKSGGLLLYLPGRGESGYRLNAGTMLRDTQDGHWHRPSASWAAAVAKYLP